MRVAVSIVVATYASGDGIERLFASLDAQTMPAEQYEVIFVDDGSPDDTVERLRRAALTRANMTVIELEHSGWPGRPRNVGVDAAQGDYVLFMDHDDTLYPDALRRVYEFALEHDSDIVSPKESRTNAVWFAMRGMSDGNIANIHRADGIARLQPLVPHKLYRRALLVEHAIRFPESRRALWEDWYVNVPAYRYGNVVSILADTPFYLWHASESNATSTFDPAREDYWDRLEELFDHFRAMLASAEFADDRHFLTSYTLRSWVIQRLSALLSRRERAAPEDEQRALSRARDLVERYGSTSLRSGMSKKHQALAHLIAGATIEQLRSYALTEKHLRAAASIAEMRWVDGRLLIDTVATWHSTDPSVVAYREQGGVFRLDVGTELARLIPPELLDLSDQLEHMQSGLGVRDRFQHVTWALPFDTQPPSVLASESASLHVVQHGRGVIDPDTTACGRPLRDAVWDLHLRTEWYGIERKTAVGCRAGRQAATVGSRAAITYRNKWHNLSLDLAQDLRTLALDAAPTPGQIGHISAFSTALAALHSSGPARIPSMLAAVPVDREPGTGDDEAQRKLEVCVAEHPFTAEVVVDAAGARLQGCGDLPSGDYRLYARQRNGLIRTAYRLTVNPAGGTQLIVSSE